ncbi:MAG: hypothetical protein VW715_08225 [Rhodospirillales bacterium]
MARFGRDLVRSLTQPAFAEGLFSVGEKLGGLPERKRKEEATKGMIEELSAAQASGDASALADIYERLGTTSGDPQYTLHAASLRNTKRINDAQIAITTNIEKLNDPTLPDSERAAIEMQVKADAMALNDPQVLSSTLSGIASGRSTSRTNTQVAAAEAVSSGKTREDFIELYGAEDVGYYDTAKAQSLAAKASIKASEEATADAEFAETMQGLQNQFEMLMAKPSDEINEQAAINLQQEMIDFAESRNKPISGYTELFSNRLQQKVADEMDAENQARLAVEAGETRWADSMVQAIISSGSENPIATLANQRALIKDENVLKVYDKKLAYIKKGVEDYFQARDEISESLKTGKPSATAIDFLKDPANANYFEGLDAAENALAEIQRINKKVANGGTLNANDLTIQRASVKIINDEVAKARNARRKQETSEPVAEINAEQAVDQYLSKFKKFQVSGLEGFFAGQSIYDAVERANNAAIQDESGNDRELYRNIVNTLKREYMLRPGIPAEEQLNIIRQVVEEAGVATSGEAAFQLREQRLEEVTNERVRLIRSWVKKTYTQNGKAPSESEIDELLNKESVRDDAYEAVEGKFVEIEQAEAEQRANTYREMQELRKTRAVRGA